MNHQEHVKAALTAAGLTPTEPEIAGLAQMYPAVRGMADGLYQVPGVLPAVPELICVIDGQD